MKISNQHPRIRTIVMGIRPPYFIGRTVKYYILTSNERDCDVLPGLYGQQSCVDHNNFNISIVTIILNLFHYQII